MQLLNSIHKHRTHSRSYILLDCLGQAEIHTLTGTVASLAAYHFRLTCVHLIDVYMRASASSYVSALLLSLNSMLRIELPHVNLMSKIDMLPAYDLPLRLDFYGEVGELSHLQHLLDAEPFGCRFAKLNAAL